MEYQPVVLEGIRRADRDSIARFGHGSAMAQPIIIQFYLCVRWINGRKSPGAWLFDVFSTDQPMGCGYLKPLSIRRRGVGRRRIRHPGSSPDRAARSTPSKAWSSVRKGLRQSAFRVHYLLAEVLWRLYTTASCREAWRSMDCCTTADDLRRDLRTQRKTKTSYSSRQMVRAMVITILEVNGPGYAETSRRERMFG